MFQTKPLNGRTGFNIFYVFFYGFFVINYIDHVVALHTVQGYHAWLIFMYFAPFLLFYDWKRIIIYGLTVSLLNDLFYAPFGSIFLGKTYDLLDWYSFQLGLKGHTTWWYLQLGVFTLPVSSLTMLTYIILRFEIIFFLIFYLHKLGNTSPCQRTAR
jgi:hypothetical protein